MELITGFKDRESDITKLQKKIVLSESNHQTKALRTRISEGFGIIFLMMFKIKFIINEILYKISIKGGSSYMKELQREFSDYYSHDYLKLM